MRVTKVGHKCRRWPFAVLLGLAGFGLTPAANGQQPFSVACNPGSGPTRVGVYFSTTCTFSGGLSPYIIGLDPETALPAGLSASSTATAVTISGTPTQTGQYSFAVIGRDSLRSSSRATFSGTIAPPASTITASCNPNVGPSRVGLYFTTTCTFSGGSAPYTIGLDPQTTLPAGVTVAQSGPASVTVSGTPTQAGPYSFGVLARDSQRLTATITFSGTITPAVSAVVLSCTPSAGPARVGVSFTTTCTASGGVAPYSFGLDAQSGVLPAGLEAVQTNATTAVVSGAPTQAGPYSFAVLVEDSSAPKLSATFGFAGTIAPAAMGLTVSCSPAAGPARLGVFYTTTCTISGGVAPYSLGFDTQGVVPAGLSALRSSTTTLVISGTPTQTGPYSFGVLGQDSSVPKQSATFAFSGTIAPASGTLTLACNPTTGPATVGVSYTTTCTVSGGVAPYSFALDPPSAIPPGLTLAQASPTTATLTGTPAQQGSYAYAIVGQDSSTPKLSASVSFNGAIAPAATPLAALQAAPLQLRFNDSNLSYSQSVTVATETDNIGVEVTTDGGSPGSPTPAWLVVGASSLTTPGRLGVSINAARRPTPGSYTARILLRAVRSTAPPVVVTVTLELKSAAIEFTVSPASLQFVAQVGGFLPAQYLVLPPGIGCSEVAVSTTDPWLTVAPEPVSDCSRFLVTARPLTSNPGTYRGLITLRYKDEVRSVRATGFLFPPGPWLDLNPNGFQFEVRQGQGNAITRNLAILNRGTGLLNWRVRDVFGPTEWLNLGAVSGTATANTDGRLPITVTPGQLPVGAYHAVIEVTAEGARSSPELFTLVMRIFPADSAPIAAPSPSGLVFTVVEGSGQSEPQTETVFASSTSSVGYRAWPQPQNEGADWLVVSSTSGVTSTGSPGRFNVSVRPGTLKPGVYQGEVNVYLTSKTSTEVRAVNVTMVVIPKPAKTAAAAAPGERLAEGCTPARLAATHTGLVNSFATSAGWPTPIAIRVVDDCGDQVNGAQAVLSFSNGDPPLVLTNLLNGTYAGTWVPRGTTDSVTIRVNIAQAALSASIELSGRISPTSTPIVSPNGVVRNFDRQEFGTLAPGTAIEIYGANLSGGTAAARIENGKLPEAVGDVAVVLGGSRLPLYNVTPGQLNAQIRMDTPVDQTLPLVVRSGNAVSVPVRIPILAQQPGLLAFTDGRIVAHDENFALLSAANPAKRGRPVILYLVGMGVTSPAVESGGISPGQPLAASAAAPQVTFGGRQAQVLFSGLTPGFVGLYQINILVPADLTPGEAKLVVRQGSNESNEVIVPVQ